VAVSVAEIVNVTSPAAPSMEIRPFSVVSDAMSDVIEIIDETTSVDVIEDQVIVEIIQNAIVLGGEDKVPYTGATDDVDLGVYSLTTDMIALNTTHTTGGEPAGAIFWNSVDGTMDLRLLNGVTLQVGQEIHFYGKASGAITNGDVVQFAGAQGDHVLIKKAVPSEIAALPQLIMGIATQDISNGSFGYVTWFGAVHDINTVTPSWAAGDLLYFDKTTGGLTNVAPTAPDRKILIAAVQKAATSAPASNGILLVRVDFGHKLSQLDDVDMTGLSSGEFIKYDGTKWVAVTPDISDVNGLQIALNDTVSGAASSTDNAITRFDGTTGKIIQDSLATVNDTGELTATRIIANGAGAITTNTAVGFQSLNSNTTGVNNAAYGSYALRDNVDGYGNMAIGAYSMISNVSGNSCTAVGYAALRYNTASSNVGIGAYALYTNTSGSSNTATGFQSLYLNTIGANNTAVGYRALYTNLDGNFNTAVGQSALYTNGAGSYNSSFGYACNYANTTANANTSMGYGALYTTSTGGNNSAFGYMALRLTTGTTNTAMGYASLYTNSSGTGNTAFGYRAGYALTTGNNNTLIGSVEGSAGLSGTIIIGAGATERIRVDSSGRMGLNGVTPTARLTLNALAEDGVDVTYTASVGNTKKPLQIKNDSGLTVFELGGNKTATEGTLILRAPTGQGTGTGRDYGL